MTHDEFIELVADMRSAQRRWFNPKTRTQAVLQESIRLERLVDREVEEHRAGRCDNQGRLFG